MKPKLVNIYKFRLCPTLLRRRESNPGLSALCPTTMAMCIVCRRKRRWKSLDIRRPGGSVQLRHLLVKSNEILWSCPSRHQRLIVLRKKKIFWSSMMMTIGGLPHPETNLELVFVTFKRPWRANDFSTWLSRLPSAVRLTNNDLRIWPLDKWRVLLHVTFKRPCRGDDIETWPVRWCTWPSNVLAEMMTLRRDLWWAGLCDFKRPCRGHDIETWPVSWCLWPSNVLAEVTTLRRDPWRAGVCDRDVTCQCSDVRYNRRSHFNAGERRCTSQDSVSENTRLHQSLPSS